MKRFGKLLIILILLGVIVQPAWSADKFNAEEYKEFINREMKTFGVPGAAILIIKGDEVLLKEGFGYRDLENKLKVTPDTLFSIGSCTKAFTAFSVGLLADEKKVELDKPIVNYYPGLILEDSYVTSKVTLRDVLCHRTGIPGYDLLWYHNTLSREQVVNRIKYLKFNTGFREKFQYNNVIFCLSGKVIEEVSGKTWEDFVKDRIFTPLGMTNSNFSHEITENSGNYALPYKFDFESLREIPENYLTLKPKQIPFIQFEESVGPAGSINSNLEDMEKWVRLYLNNGMLKKKRIISAESLLSMISPQIPTGDLYNERSEFTTKKYGLGWGMFDYRGDYLVQHAGGIDGFTSLVALMPKEKVAVVILTNMDSTQFHTVASMGAFDRIRGNKPIDWSGRLTNAVKTGLRALKDQSGKEAEKIKQARKPSNPLEDYAGTYVHPAFGRFIIVYNKEKDKLSFKFHEYEMPLKHEHYNTFQGWNGIPLGQMNLIVNFNLDRKGNVKSISVPLAEDAEDVEFMKKTDK